MRDIQTITDMRPALPPAQYTASFTGVIIDTKGIGALDFNVFAGALAAAAVGNYFEFKLTHGNASDLSDGTDVALADLIVDGTPGDVAGVALPRCNATTLAGKRVTRIGYRGFGHRYVRLAGTETGTADQFLSASALCGHLAKSPV